MLAFGGLFTCYTKTIFPACTLTLLTGSQKPMVSDFEMNSNKEKARLLFCSVLIIINKIIKMALTDTKRNDGKASELWCTETDDNQMRLGLKEVQVQWLHLTVVSQH